MLLLVTMSIWFSSQQQWQSLIYKATLNKEKRFAAVACKNLCLA